MTLHDASTIVAALMSPITLTPCGGRIYPGDQRSPAHVGRDGMRGHGRLRVRRTDVLGLLSCVCRDALLTPASNQHNR